METWGKLATYICALFVQLMVPSQNLGIMLLLFFIWSDEKK
jgi:hypothetical protein